MMGAYMPPEFEDDQVKKEGDAAHWLVQQVCEGHFDLTELTDRKAPNGVYLTSSMVEDVGEYLDFVLSKRAKVEVDTSHSGKGWEIRGRGDAVAYDPKNLTLYVPDLKFGWGIVEPDENWTLISHAIGWHVRNPMIRIDRVVTMIFQPRPFHPLGSVREWSIDFDQFMNLYGQIDSTLRNPSDVLMTGAHCRKCPNAGYCAALRRSAMYAIDVSMKAFVEELSNEELSKHLDLLNTAKERLKAITDSYEDMTKRRIRSGQIVPNRGLEMEQTNRQFQEWATPEFIQAMTGIDPRDKPKLITPAELERRGGNKEFVKTITHRVDKGFKLVRVDATKKAAKTFTTTQGN